MTMRNFFFGVQYILRVVSLSLKFITSQCQSMHSQLIELVKKKLLSHEFFFLFFCFSKNSYNRTRLEKAVSMSIRIHVNVCRFFSFFFSRVCVYYFLRPIFFLGYARVFSLCVCIKGKNSTFAVLQTTASHIRYV